jgi:hypothetical protein
MLASIRLESFRPTCRTTVCTRDNTNGHRHVGMDGFKSSLNKARPDLLNRSMKYVSREKEDSSSLVPIYSRHGYRFTNRSRQDWWYLELEWTLYFDRSQSKGFGDSTSVQFQLGALPDHRNVKRQDKSVSSRLQWLQEVPRGCGSR